MSQKKYDLLVFIGRFQPLHIGHLAVIQQAATLAHHVLILIGSAGKPRSIKNPWTYEERSAMIYQSVGDEVANQITTKPLYDKTYNDQQWATQVQDLVYKDYDIGRTPRIGIIGHTKDHSSFYLQLFPQWGAPVEHELNEKVDATDIRALYFEQKNIRYLSGLLPLPVFDMLVEFSKTRKFEYLVKEYDHIKQYKASWNAAPWPVTFVTTDAVVIQSGHVLLVVRGAAPGEGLLALPGGFLNQYETVDDGILRELREETKLKVPLPVLRGNIKARQVFDDPFRSSRGRTITHAALIELPPGPLPPVKGADDAKKAMWVPLSELREDNMFEDHYHIINWFMGQV